MGRTDKTKLTKSDTLLKKSEKEHEDFLLDNIDYISECCLWGEIVRIERQFRITLSQGCVIADIMLWHKDGTGTCIEVKTGKNNRNDDLMGLSQLLFYGFIMENSLQNMPRLVLATPTIKGEIFAVIQKYNLPISILNYSENKCIYLGYGSSKNN
jgi:RecB family endonuclease NucS